MNFTLNAGASSPLVVILCDQNIGRLYYRILCVSVPMQRGYNSYVITCNEKDNFDFSP